MGNFKEAENPRHAAFKAHSPCFTPEARSDGIYRGRPRPFCLPADRAEENVYFGIREPALDCFAGHHIKWHDGHKPENESVGKPSNHLCDSQVCCVNFLFPFADKPDALAELLHPIFPTVRKMMPMEGSGQYVSSEWIGERNYLGEKVSRNGKRTRGANFTSADAAAMFECLDGTRQIVLIEWKYTESYSPVDMQIAGSGTDRTAIYRHLYAADDFPLRKELLPDFGSLFYEPFYQLLRQQMLANEMEKAHELGADRVSLLHITPRHNADFPRVTSPKLAHLGPTVIDVWRRLVKEPNGFASVSTETLFGCFPVQKFPETAAWWQYITARYPWVLERSEAY
jgi:hypothetical protein